MREIALALRRLRRDPWATAGAVVAAALGAGLNTAVFAVAFGVLGRPLPYTQPDRLVVINAEAPLAAIEGWRLRLPSFASVTGYARENLTVQGAGDSRLATIAFVDDHFFDTLGARPISGRTFGRGEAAVVVLGERFTRQSGLAPDRAPGTALTIGGVAVTVAGVVPASFAFPTDRIDLWMTGASAPVIGFDSSADARRFRLVGRLKAGVSLAQAGDDATRARLEADPPSRRRASGPVRVEKLEDVLVGSVRPVLRAFSAAAAIVLLVACANVATILVGRTIARRRELAVQRALGASPMRLFSSVVSESLLIAFAGAALGIGFAVGSVRLLSRWAAGIIPRLGDIGVDWVVLLFASAVAAAAALVAALPAIRALGAGTENLRSHTSARIGDRRIRGALIVTQIALAVVLLAGGGLLARTIAGLLRADIGVTTRGAAVTQLLLTEGASFRALARAPVLQRIVDQVRALPGVTAAGAGSTMPPNNAAVEVTVRFVRENIESLHSFAASSVTPGFLPALGARILQGRDFAAGDEHPERPVVVLSESAARAFFPNDRDVVNRELPMALPGLRARGSPRVIGVVSDIKYSGLEADAGPALYVSWQEFPAGHVYLAVRTGREDPLALAAPLRGIVRDADSRIPAMPIRSLDDVIQRSVSDRRLNALLGTSIALLAFAVAMVGLAASLMRVVSERRQELAIRAALGATPARAVRSVVGEGALLAGLGVAIGCGGALAIGRALGSMLHGVSPHDPLTLTAVAVFVGGASLLACYLPARRAAQVEPIAALRGE